MASRLSPARSILNVSATAADSYRTISDAVAAAGHGDVISIQPGTYIESVVLHREITLSAAGSPGGVRIESRDVPTIRIAGESATLSGVVVRHSGEQTSAIDVPTGRLRMDECTVEADSAAALYAHGAAEVNARGCEFTNPGGAGVIFVEGAEGSLTECTLRDVKASAVVIRTGANPQLVDCTITDVAGSGLLAAERARGTVRDCRIIRAGNPAVAIEGDSSPHLSATVIEEAEGVGVLIASGSTPLLEDCAVTGAGAQGIALVEGAAPDLQRLEVRESGGYGVHVLDSSTGTFTECVVASSGDTAVVVSGASTSSFEGLRVEGGGGPGVSVSESATPTFDELRVDRTAGSGLEVRSGAHPRIRRAVVSSPGEDGIVVTEQGRGLFEDVTVTDAAGAGVHVSQGGRPELRGCAFTRSGAAAVHVTGGEADLEEGDISDGQAEGVLVANRASARLTRTRIRACRRTGIEWSAGSSGEASECEVTAAGGDGILVHSTEPVTLRDCLVHDNAGAGLRVTTPTERLEVTRVTSRANGAEDTYADVRGDGADPRGDEQKPPSPRYPPGRRCGRARTRRRNLGSGPPPGRTGGPSAARSASCWRSWRRWSGSPTSSVEVTTLVRLHQMAARRASVGLPAPPLSRHLVFTGSPGTGKTTVARLYGRILAELGVLSTGQLSRSPGADLVAQISAAPR